MFQIYDFTLLPFHLYQGNQDAAYAVCHFDPPTRLYHSNRATVCFRLDRIRTARRRRDMGGKKRGRRILFDKADLLQSILLVQGHSKILLFRLKLQLHISLNVPVY